MRVEIAHALTRWMNSKRQEVLPFWASLSEPVKTAYLEQADEVIEIFNKHKTNTCIACPLEVRSLFAAAFNGCNAFEQMIQGHGSMERAIRKITELREQLDKFQPLVDAHFDNRHYMNDKNNEYQSDLEPKNTLDYRV